MSDNNTSFYIPAIGNMSECDIATAFHVTKVGVVDRVDFFENSSGVWCAFVHFVNFYNNHIVNRLLHEISEYGSCKFWFNVDEYFIVRKMTCPKIPATSMNIHQIADKLTQHEEKIAELEAKILKQDEIIDEYRRKQCETIEYGRLAHRAMWTRSQSDDSYDVDMNELVNSLISPRWPEEDDSKLASIYPEASDDCMSVEM
jgi:hypothetical protein